MGSLFFGGGAGGPKLDSNQGQEPPSSQAGQWGRSKRIFGIPKGPDRAATSAPRWPKAAQEGLNNPEKIVLNRFYELGRQGHFF